MTLTLLVPFVAIGALGGCGDPEPPSIDKLPAEEERVICAREVACGGALDQSTCEATIFLVEDGKTATGIAAVKRGTLAYNGALARRCLDAITTDCATIHEWSDLCEGLVTGKVAVGGVCLLDDECADGGKCEIPSCVDACCPGTCAASTRLPLVPLGGSCAPGTDCVSGAACLDGICAPPRAVGATCKGVWRECAAPAVCLATPPGGTGTCTVLPTSRGAPCDPGASYGCGRDDERCDAASRTCVPLSAPGSACQTIGDCVGYSYCDAGGTCRVRPIVGQSCDAPIDIPCMGSLVCRNGVCATPTLEPACLSTGA